MGISGRQTWQLGNVETNMMATNEGLGWDAVSGTSVGVWAHAREGSAGIGGINFWNHFMAHRGHVRTKKIIDG